MSAPAHGSTGVQQAGVTDSEFSVCYDLYTTLQIYATIRV